MGLFGARRERKLAEARLAELRVRLDAWRGPALLVDAGDELLTLGRAAEAEAAFREARERGAGVKDANLGLAEALLRQGRVEEAVPVLQELSAADDDHAMGRGQLLLARCLDRLGRHDEAEAALRRILTHRNTPEARVRLARLVILRGEDVVGRGMARDAVEDVRTMGGPLRRRNSAWATWGRRVARGDVRLPDRPLLESDARSLPALGPPRGWSPWAWIGLAAVAGLGLMFLGFVAPCLMGAWLVRQHGDDMEASLRAVQHDLPALRSGATWTVAQDPAAVVLQARDVDAYLRMRALVASGGRLADPMLSRDATESFAGARAILQACRESSVSPESLARLIAVVDGRFLGRAEARLFELPATVREAATGLIRERRWDGPFEERDAEIARILALAPAGAPIHPETAGALELRRSDLEATAAEDVPFLLDAFESLALLESYGPE